MNDQKVWQCVLREARWVAGLTQEELATRSGLSSRTISDIENGRAVPRSSTVQLLARALRMSPAVTDQVLTAAQAQRRKPPSHSGDDRSTAG